MYHSHLGEVDKRVISDILGSLLNEGEVSEVHAQVGDTRGVTAVQCIPHVPEPAVRGHQCLQPLYHLFCLKYSILDLVPPSSK